MTECPTFTQFDAGEECGAQAGLFALLGRCLEAEIDARLLTALRGELREPLAEAGVDSACLDGDIDRVLGDAAVEFAALFVVPGAASPYASTFQTGALFQEPADRVARWYADNGFAFRNAHSGEFPDHVGTMLAFVGKLYEAEATALAESRVEAAREVRERRGRFVVEELGSWAPGWCRVAAAVAEHPFYRQVLALTERVLWEELSNLVSARRLRELSAANARGPARMPLNPDYRKASGL